MIRCFHLYGNDRGTRLGEFLYVTFRIGNHEMTIQGKLGSLVDGSRYTGAKTDVRHKMSVHDIEVNVTGTPFFDCRETLLKMKKVGVKYAGGYYLWDTHGSNIVSFTAFYYNLNIKRT